MSNRRRDRSNRRMPPTLAIAAAAVSVLDASCDYLMWFKVAAAIHTITEGSEEGLDVFDAWSAQSYKYPSRRRIEYMWQSIGRYQGERRMGMGTLARIVKEEGTESWTWVLAQADDGNWGDDGER